MKEKVNNTIVLTAHGKIGNEKIKAPTNVVTVCKLGEVHSSKHLTFNDLGIFSSRNYLVNYVLNGTDYTNQGEFLPKDTTIPGIILTPIAPNDGAKPWSWQKPYVENHFRKMCAYELINTNEEFRTKNYSEKYHAVQTCTVNDISGHTNNDINLLNKLSILDDYSNRAEYENCVDINNHGCSITKIKSLEGIINVLDYELSNKEQQEWHILDAVHDIVNFMGDNFDINDDYFILKACLS